MIHDAGLVVDASVAIKLGIPEEGSAAARAVFAARLSGEVARLLVPDLFFAECAGAFRTGILRYRLPAAAVERALLDLCALCLESSATRDLAPAALSLANAEGLSVQDACYVALSDRTGAPLVTADRKLHDRLDGSRHRVMWLGEFAAA